MKMVKSWPDMKLRLGRRKNCFNSMKRTVIGVYYLWLYLMQLITFVANLASQ